MTMNAPVTCGLCAPTHSNFDQAAGYILNNSFDKPTLLVSREQVGVKYDALNVGLGNAPIHYGVKANPVPYFIR